MDHFCKLCFMLMCVMLSRLFSVALWSPAGKGLTMFFCLMFVMPFCASVSLV